MPEPSKEATYERARRLANVAMWSIDLQCRRLRGTEPEDETFVFRKWADFDFLVVGLTRLRRAAQLAADIPGLESVADAIADFDHALPDLKTVRDVAEHIDAYAVDKGFKSPKKNDEPNKKTVVRQSLEVSTMDDDGPTLHWLDASLDARDAFRASQRLFEAIKDGSKVFSRAVS